MRTRQLRTLVVFLVVTFMLSSFPVEAAPRGRNGWFERELPFIGKVIKHIRTSFGIRTNADGLTLPTP